MKTMIAALTITAPQLKRLQILYGQFERHTLNTSPGRDARCQWASEATGRTISSFKDLTLVEAKRLIDGLQRELRIKAPNKSPRKDVSRHHRQKLGTEGRRDQIHNETTLAGPREFALIQRDLDRLGWTQDRLDGFVRSANSPIKPRTVIRTLADANRIHWALKRITPDSDRTKAS